MSGLGQWLVKISYGLFPAAYVYAEAAYGLTRSVELLIFLWALGGIVSMWFVGHVLQGRLPRIGRWPWILSAAILILGWTVTAVSYVDAGITEGTLPDSWDGLIPDAMLIHWNSWDAKLSAQAMLRTMVLLGGMLMAIDFWRDEKRGRVLLVTIVLTAFGMVLFFLEQKLIAPDQALTSEDGSVHLSFATYRYHGNGASYLNLCWPFAAAIALFAILRQTPAWPLWLLPLAATFIATFINISKAGNVLSAVGIFLFLALCIPFLTKGIKRSRRKLRRSHLIVAALPLLIVLLSIPFALPWKRWNNLVDKQDSTASRSQAYVQFAQMAKDAGVGGFGPGTFAKFSGLYTGKDLVLRQLHYLNAHEDYLQTVIEWGYAGAFLWGLLLVPPLFFLLKGTFRRSKRSPREFEGYRIGLWDHLKPFFGGAPLPWEPCVAAAGATAMILTALHSAVDFPMQIASLQFHFLTVIALGWSYRLIQPEDEASEDVSLS
ncbi:MAG: O-antigen ligase family protein [Chthoniobacterales bacterium]